MAKPTAELTKDETNALLGLGGTLGEIFSLSDRGFTFEDMRDLFTTQHQRRVTDERDARAHQAEVGAQAMKKALIPENSTAPGHSVYSYPEGDAARPRPQLRCETLWLNAPMEGDVDTVEEIELANQLTIGEYLCTKSDGSRIKVEVTAMIDPATGRYQKLTVLFPTRGQHKNNLTSKVAMMKEMIAQAAQRREPATVGA